jgi:hypothetical protein
MTRDCRRYFAKLVHRAQKRFAKEQIRAARHYTPSGEELGDERLGRLMKVLAIFEHARMPNGQAMAPALQQREFINKIVNAALPIIYGSTFNVKVKRDRILKRLGFKNPKKTLLMRTPRQFGKTTIIMMAIAALAVAFPSFHLVTAQLLDVGQKLVMGVIEIIKVIQAHAGGMMMPKIDNKHESVNRVWLLWPNGAKSVVKRFTAKRKRYVLTHTLHARQSLIPSGAQHLSMTSLSERGEAHPVREIVESVGAEWLVIVDLDVHDPCFKEQQDLESLAHTLQGLFPYKPAVKKNPYNLPFMKKGYVECVREVPVRNGVLVYNPQEKQVKEFNQRATELCGKQIYGRAVVLCQTEEDADEVENEVNDIIDPMNGAAKALTILVGRFSGQGG